MIAFSVEDLLGLIKAYAAWCSGSVDEVRPCPRCPCRYRHKHGYVQRQVAWDLWTVFPMAILRMRCPRCGRTERIYPPWLPVRSAYPWPVWELASIAYLSGMWGYRLVAQERRLDFTVLWHWVDQLAQTSVVWVGRVAAEIVRWGGVVPTVPVDEARLTYKSRSEAKAYRLARLVALWPLLGALAAACRPWLPELEPPGVGMTLAFWNAYRTHVVVA